MLFPATGNDFQKENKHTIPFLVSLLFFFPNIRAGNNDIYESLYMGFIGLQFVAI